jgi:hypothetical protein
MGVVVVVDASPLHTKGPSDFGILSSENTPTEILRRSTKNKVGKKKRS